MIMPIRFLHKIDEKKLMNIYRESNEENTDYFYPNITDKHEALQRVEHDFLHFIQNDFFSENKQNQYMVLVIDDIWVSALRLYFIKDGFYYIEALETHPEYRKKGYATELLLGVIDRLKEKEHFTLCDCVSKKNIASLATHKKCGFKIASDKGYDYLQNEIDENCVSMQYEA